MAAFREDGKEKVDTGDRAVVARHKLQLFRRNLGVDRHEHGSGRIAGLGRPVVRSTGIDDGCIDDRTWPSAWPG